MGIGVAVKSVFAPITTSITFIGIIIVLLVGLAIFLIVWFVILPGKSHLQANGNLKAYKTKDVSNLLNFVLNNSSSNKGLFSGGASIGTKVVFASSAYHYIVVYDVATDTLDANIDLNKQNLGTTTDFFSGVVSINDTTVILIPDKSKFICEYNAASKVLTKKAQIDTTRYSFSGGISEGNKVYFTPKSGANIGVYDYDKDSFTAKTFTSVNSTQFNGAVLLDDNIYFAPVDGNSNKIDILSININDNSVNIDSHTISNIKDSMFGGATKINNDIIFAPSTYDSAVIYSNPRPGVSPGGYNTTSVPDELKGVKLKYNGAAQLNGKAYFAPYNTKSFGVFDKKDFTTFTVDGIDLVSNQYLFSGVVLNGNSLVYVPYKSNKIVVYSEFENKWVFPITTSKTNGLIKFDKCEESFYFENSIVDKVHDSENKDYKVNNCNGVLSSGDQGGININFPKN